MLYVVFGATLAGDVTQINFMCSNFYLNTHKQLKLSLIETQVRYAMIIAIRL